MANRLQLSSPYRGMSFIWNVTQPVGDHVNCPNSSTDVELVAIMAAELIRTTPNIWIHRSVQNPFLTNGQMDVNLAYWIRIFNADVHRNLISAEEGIISPARGQAFGSGQIWTIVKLNATLYENSPHVWQTIPTHANASPALRRELA